MSLELDVCVLSCEQILKFLTQNNTECYEKLKIGQIYVEKSANLTKFWPIIAKTVTEVDISEFKSENLSISTILSHFFQILVLTLDHPKFLKDVNGTKYDSVRELHVKKFISRDIDRLLEAFPRLKRLYIETTSTEDEFSLNFLQKHALILKSFIIKATPREWISIITELESVSDLKLEILEAKIEKEQILELLMPFVSDLRTFVLYTNHCPSIKIPNLHILYIDFIQDLTNFGPFELQTELKELNLKLSKSQYRFQHQSSECFFGHESLSLPSLKKLVLEGFNNKNCVECFEKMFQSCKNLQYLMISNTTIGTGIFDLLIKHQQELKEVRLELARISESKIIEFCEAFPGLEVLEIKVTVIQGSSDAIIQVICEHLPKLTELRVTMFDITELSFDHVAHYCRNLQILYFSIGGNFDLERVFRVFEHCESLNRICHVLEATDLTRIDYHEVFISKIKDIDSYLERKNCSNSKVDYYVMTWDVDMSSESKENV